MRKLAILAFLIHTSLNAVTLPRGTKVFNDYQEPILVENLTPASCITVISNGDIYDAEIENLSINSAEVSFDILDYTDSQLKTELDRQKLFNPGRHLQVTTSTAKTLVGLALLANLPGADGAFLTHHVCTIVCKALSYSACGAIGALITPFVGPGVITIIGGTCVALEEAGSIPACIALCVAIPAP